MTDTDPFDTAELYGLECQDEYEATDPLDVLDEAIEAGHELPITVVGVRINAIPDAELRRHCATVLLHLDENLCDSYGSDDGDAMITPELDKKLEDAMVAVLSGMKSYQGCTEVGRRTYTEMPKEQP